MNLINLVFLVIFVGLLILLIISVFIAFVFKYKKYLLVKNKINKNKLSVSSTLKDALNSPFWVYKVFLSHEVGDEIDRIISNEKELKILDSRSKKFLALQILTLLTLFLLFFLYVVVMVIVS